MFLSSDGYGWLDKIKTELFWQENPPWPAANPNRAPGI
jgi:hypothetical protein